MKKIFTLFIGLFSSTAIYCQAPEYRWAQQIGSIGNDNATSVATDADGNIYTTGYFMKSADFDPGPGTFLMIAEDYNDVFILKTNAAGQFLWAKSMGGSYNENSFSITVDNAGNVYTTGFFEGTADFDPGPGVYNLTASGVEEIFISKLNKNGDFLWAKKIGDVNYEAGNSITTDAAGNIYVCGKFNGKVDFNPGTAVNELTSNGAADAFILKLNKGGNYVWAKALGGATDDNATAILVDAKGNVYTSGAFTSTVDFDPGAGTALYTSTGNEDAFISKLDASGNYSAVWVLAGAAKANASAITTDSIDNVYVTGEYTGDLSAGTFNLSAMGNNDAFILKINSNSQIEWVKNIGGTGSDYGQGIATDKVGSVYAMGYFQGTVDFDPNAGTYNLKGSGLYVLKLDGNGQMLWATTTQGTGNVTGHTIQVDANYHVFVGGVFSGTVDFDPSAGEAISDASSVDIFVWELAQPSLASVKKLSLQNFIIYPNPSQAYFTIKTIDNNEPFNFEVYDCTGQLMLEGVVTIQQTIDLSAFTNGVYVIKTKNKLQQVFSERLVKM